jgi:phospholipase/lecithinase/hemolysin
MEKRKSINKLSIAVASTAIALGTVSALPVEAMDLNFKGMYVVGGSLSDTGNDLIASGGLVPNEPFFFPGRFSNGKVWVEYLADELGLNPAPLKSLSPGTPLPADGINFAFGGATTSDKNVNPLLPGLRQQIDWLTGLNAQFDFSDDALYILDLGSTAANDYLGGFAKTPISSVHNSLNAARAVAQTGARDVLVINLPNLSKTALGFHADSATSHTLRILSRMHNRLLAKGLKKLGREFPETNFITFDLNALLKSIVAKPEKYGFKNVMDSCTNTNLYDPTFQFDPTQLTTCPNPEDYLFWDSVHPTTKAQQIIAQSVLDFLSSELGEDKLASLSVRKTGSYSKSIAKEVSIPEPTSAIGLLAFGALGAVSRKT